MNSKELGNLSDRDLVAVLRIFSGGTLVAPTDFALTVTETADFKNDLSDFEAALDIYDAAQAAEDTARQTKNNLRKAIVQTARQQINMARANLTADDPKLTTLGLDVYDTKPTDSPAPSSVPIAHVDYGKLKHTIFFRDSTMPDSEAKPDGVQGCEIWRFIGASAPVSEKDYDFVTLDTGSPYVAFYDGADAGKNVFYILRWVSKGGEKGGWGASINATVNG